jgi:hypothetical protein
MEAVGAPAERMNTIRNSRGKLAQNKWLGQAWLPIFKLFCLINL